MRDEKVPLIPEQVKKEANRQLSEAMSAWRGGIKSFVDRHISEMERQKHEFEEMDKSIEENFRNGPRRTNGFIV